MRERLRVRLGLEPVAARLEAVAELAEVLDDPVVDDRDLAGAIDVRMRVEIVRAAVRCPARVGEAHRGMGGPVGDRRRQVGELAGLLLDEEVALLVHEGDSRGVIAAVLEAPKPLHEDRPRLTGSRVADDAAHRFRSLVW